MKRLIIAYLSFLLVSTCGYCMGSEKTTIINTGVPKIEGHLRIDASRFMKIPFELKKSYHLTDVQVYLRALYKKSTIRLELMGPGDKNKKKLLSRRNVSVVKGRSVSPTWRPILTHSIALDPGTYDIIISTKDLGLIAELPYSKAETDASVRLFESKKTNKVNPTASKWLPMEEKYSVGLIVVGFPLE